VHRHRLLRGGKGKDGRCLILGPPQDAEWSEADDTLRSTTDQMLICCRVIEPDPQKAAALKQGVQVYPLSRKAVRRRSVSSTPTRPEI